MNKEFILPLPRSSSLLLLEHDCLFKEGKAGCYTDIACWCWCFPALPWCPWHGIGWLAAPVLQSVWQWHPCIQVFVVHGRQDLWIKGVRQRQQ
jgi:hypothetical protein